MSININLQEHIRKYLNRYGYSDINPIGKIIGVKGKATFIVKRVVAGKIKLKWSLFQEDFQPSVLMAGPRSMIFTKQMRSLIFVYQSAH